MDEKNTPFRTFEGNEMPGNMAGSPPWPELNPEVCDGDPTEVPASAYAQARGAARDSWDGEERRGLPAGRRETDMVPRATRPEDMSQEGPNGITINIHIQFGA